MAQLYASPLRGSAEPGLEDDLPGLSALPSIQLVKVGLDQVDAALKTLGKFLEESGITLPSTTKIRSAFDDRHELSADDLRRAVLDLHVELLTTLTAADFRCGKAYGLGRALADTCGFSQSSAELARHLGTERAGELTGWLSDLKTLLPDHAAEAVAQSFKHWAKWARTNPEVLLDDDDRIATSRMLHRQGQRWRAVLSGEKAGTDVLEIDDYVSVARGALRRTGTIAGAVARRALPLLGVALALLIFGILLIVLSSGAARVIAGLGTIAVSLGITWRSASSSCMRLARQLEAPIWGGELDRAIAERISEPFPPITRVKSNGAPRGTNETDEADTTVVLPIQRGTSLSEHRP
jgi:hypothetical protein